MFAHLYLKAKVLIGVRKSESDKLEAHVWVEDSLEGIKFEESVDGSPFTTLLNEVRLSEALLDEESSNKGRKQQRA